MPYKKLMSAKTTTGASTTFAWSGGFGIFSCNDVGTGTVKLQHSPDSETTWIDTGGAVTFASTEGVGSFQLPAGVTIRALATAASSTGRSRS